MFRKTARVAVTVLALTGMASPAFAQVCTGFAMAPGAMQATLMGEFPDGATMFGGSVARKSGDQLIYGVGYAYTSVDDVLGVEMPAQHTFSGFGSYEIGLNAASAGPSFVACPNVQFGYTKFEDANIFAVPLSVSLGTTFEVADGIVLAPYFNPGLHWHRVSVDDFSDSETNFGWALGGNMSISSSFLVGAQYYKVGDGDGVFGLRFGLIF